MMKVIYTNPLLGDGDVLQKIVLFKEKVFVYAKCMKELGVP
jgi:hypothetical protein